MENDSKVNGGQRLSDDEARKRFLRSRQGAAAKQHHDERVGAHALRQAQAMAGKRAPVFPTMQTVGCSASKKFVKR